MVVKTLIKLFGDEILSPAYMEDESLSEMERYEKIIDEILHGMNAR